MTSVFTIGYEGASLDEVLRALANAGVTMLVDVREVAASRRKGFSKTALKAALEGVGIEYTHLRALGDPKAGREAARNGYMNEFRRIFTAHFEGAPAQAQFEELRTLINHEVACLLCFEHKHTDCHRTIITDRLAQTTRVEVEHLKPTDIPNKQPRPVAHHNQSGATPVF